MYGVEIERRILEKDVFAIFHVAHGQIKLSYELFLKFTEFTYAGRMTAQQNVRTAVR